MSLPPEPFVDLYRQHYADVMRYARRRVGASAADDVVAETFLVALRRPTAVPADPLPWLYGVARRVIANAERSQRRAGRLRPRLRDAPSGDGDPATEVAERLVVRQALSRLSARDREILLLVAWEGLTLDQAARALDCTAGAAAVRLHRARRRLERALATAAPAEDDPALRSEVIT